MQQSDPICSEGKITLNARLTALLFLSALSTLVNAQTGPSAVWEKFHLAVANSDRAAAASVLAADVQIFESGFVERSRDEYLTHHFEADAKFAKAVPRKVNRRSEQTAGNMALVLEETETNGSYEGQPVKLIGTETAVLRLDGGSWRIVHIHWSSRKPKP
jgi:ketosteroid isomerase-like protein